MIKIYRKAIGFFVASLPGLLVFAIVIEVLLWVLQPNSEGTVSFIALSIIAYSFHRHFLFDEPIGWRAQKPAEGAPPFRIGWFLVISTVLVVVLLGLAFGASFALANRPAFAIILLTFFPAYLLVLSLFGMALPASVARDGSYRVAQGIRAAFHTGFLLVTGPGVVGMILLVATVAGAWALRGVAEDSLILLAHYIILRTLGFLTTIFAVAVLCEVYAKTRPGTLSKAPSATGQMPA